MNTGIMTVDGIGVLEHARATNARHVLAGTFPHMPSEVIDKLMRGELELREEADGRYTPFEPAPETLTAEELNELERRTRPLRAQMGRAAIALVVLLESLPPDSERAKSIRREVISLIEGITEIYDT